MSSIRADGSFLNDPNDDEAFQLLVGDVKRLKQEVRQGSSLGYGGGEVGGEADLSGVMLGANNLSDVSNTATARTNLGLPTTAYFYGSNTGSSFSASSNALLALTASHDSASGWNAGTRLYTVQVAGVYDIATTVYAEVASLTPINSVGISVAVELNAGTTGFAPRVAFANTSAAVTGFGYLPVPYHITKTLAVGDTIGFRAYNISTLTATVSGVASMTLLSL